MKGQSNQVCLDMDDQMIIEKVYGHLNTSKLIRWDAVAFSSDKIRALLINKAGWSWKNLDSFYLYN